MIIHQHHQFFYVLELLADVLLNLYTNNLVQVIYYRTFSHNIDGDTCPYVQNSTEKMQYEKDMT